VLTLTREEAAYLRDIVDWWLEGYEAATNDVINDRSLDNPEDLLSAVSGMYEHHDLAAKIKTRIRTVLERTT
jgi:hypothetical protein